MSNKRIKVTTVILILTFLICIVIMQPQDNEANIFKCISASATITLVLSYIYIHWLWKLSPFKEFHQDILIIDGKWASTITLEDDTTILLDVKISQTFDSVKITIKSNVFIAKSITSAFIKDPDKLILYFIYHTKDLKKKNSNHTPHIGTMKLHCLDNQLKGFYYTDLKTSDEITFIKVNKEDEIDE